MWRFSEVDMKRFHEQVMGIYFDDLDSYKILHNARYLLLFERTLGSFWEHLELGSLQVDRDLFHFVRANHVEYLRPKHGTGKVRVRVWIERMGRTSLTFGFRMMQITADIDYAVGSRTIVCVDPETHKPSPWSDTFRSVLAPYLAAE